MNYKALEQKIITSYQEGVTPLTGETLAAEFLAAQISVSEEIKKAALNARLLKSQLKEQRAKLFYKEATTPEKKPSDTLLQAMVDKDPDISQYQAEFDISEEDANELERLYNIFREAHIFYRSISRGKFD